MSVPEGDTPTVYLVTYGEYSEYQVVGVFETEAEAEEYIRGYEDGPNVRIEEWRVGSTRPRRPAKSSSIFAEAVRNIISNVEPEPAPGADTRPSDDWTASGGIDLLEEARILMEEAAGAFFGGRIDRAAHLAFVAYVLASKVQDANPTREGLAALVSRLNHMRGALDRFVTTAEE